MKWKEITIDLSKPPDRRWEQLSEFREGMNALINFFSGEILELVPAEYLDLLHFYVDHQMEAEHAEELLGISEVAGIPLKKIMIGNLYYDALKIVLGCSAFSIMTDSGPVHGRNLDWYSNDNDLSTHSLVTRFINGNNEYLTVGWPGFTGCLSGMAPGKFSISLNAVMSSEPSELAEPVVYLIRKVLENASGFEEAVQILSDTNIASDCLLMVCGTKESEMAVIERTPSKSKVRFAQNGRIMVTNDYKLFNPSEETSIEVLSETSCGRYDRMDVLLKQGISSNADVHRVLSDYEVKMGITMQQMCFHSKTGKFELF